MNGECKLDYADINQMAGRGNRSQGVPEATVILTKSKEEASCDTILAANDFALDIDLVDRLKYFYNDYPRLNFTRSRSKALRHELREYMKEKGWKNRIDTLSENARLLLTGGTLD